MRGPHGGCHCVPGPPSSEAGDSRARPSPGPLGSRWAPPGSPTGFLVHLWSGAGRAWRQRDPGVARLSCMTGSRWRRQQGDWLGLLRALWGQGPPGRVQRKAQGRPRGPGSCGPPSGRGHLPLGVPWAGAVTGQPGPAGRGRALPSGEKGSQPAGTKKGGQRRSCWRSLPQPGGPVPAPELTLSPSLWPLRGSGASGAPLCAWAAPRVKQGATKAFGPSIADSKVRVCGNTVCFGFLGGTGFPSWGC